MIGCLGMIIIAAFIILGVISAASSDIYASVGGGMRGVGVYVGDIVKGWLGQSGNAELDSYGIGMVVLMLLVILFMVLAVVVLVRLGGNEKKEAPVPPKAVKTKILDGGSDGTKAGGVGRAIVGDIVAGPVGAVVGAATAGHKNMGFTVFKVWYDDGHDDVEKIAHDDPKYMEYLKLLEE